MRTMLGGTGWKVVREDEELPRYLPQGGEYRGQYHARRRGCDLHVSPQLFGLLERKGGAGEITAKFLCALIQRHTDSDEKYRVDVLREALILVEDEARRQRREKEAQPACGDPQCPLLGPGKEGDEA